MSEDNKEKPTKDETTVIVEDTLAGAQSKNIILQRQVDELTEKLDVALTELDTLKERASNQVKAQLIADIIDQGYTEPKEVLILKTVDELKQILMVLNKAPLTSFKSGTPVKDSRTAPRRLLDNKFAEAQARRKGGNK